MDKTHLTRKKYRFTVGNILSVAAFCCALYFFVTPDPEGWAYLGGIVLALFGIIGISVDFILQSLIKNYWYLTIIELVLLGVAYIVLQ